MKQCLALCKAFRRKVGVHESIFIYIQNIHYCGYMVRGKESRALEHNTQNEGALAHSKTSGSMKHSFGLGRASYELTQRQNKDRGCVEAAAAQNIQIRQP